MTDSVPHGDEGAGPEPIGPPADRPGSSDAAPRPTRPTPTAGATWPAEPGTEPVTAPVTGSFTEPFTGSAPAPTQPVPGHDPWSAPVDVSPGVEAGGPVPPGARPRGRGFLVLVSAAVAAVLVGGAAFAWAAFNGDTGDQPERHLPASTGAFLKLDLAPSAGQKIDAIRFFAKFPFAKGLDGTDDPRKFLYEQVTKGQPTAPPWSQVEPWLGQRVAVAAVPGTGDDAAPVVLLQVTDEAKAKASLDKIAAAHTGSDAVFGVADGWATLSDTKAHLDAVTGGAKAGNLADDPTFRADVDAVGEQGVLSGWADPGRFPSLTKAFQGSGSLALGLPGALPGGQDALKQRYAMAARFTGGNAEFVLKSIGSAASAATGTGAGRAVDQLPEGTVAAIGMSGVGESLKKTWASLGKEDSPFAGSVDALAEQTGLRLPDDLVALFGDQVALALGEPDASGQPVVGLRGASAAAGVGGALDRLLRFTDASGLPLERRDVSGGYVLATTRGEADALAKGGTLGQSDAFRDAVPDADRAAVVGYVDVQRVLETYGRSADADTVDALKPLRAVGLSVSTGSDSATLTLRVTTR